jgi:Uma2 family endonuclease
MVTMVIQEAKGVTVPAWVTDRESFLRWTDDDSFPEYGRIDYLAGEIWIDMSEEQIYSHNQVKTEFTFVLTGLAKASRLGRFYQDGLRIDHPEADLAAVPDGVYISRERLESLRIRKVEGAEGGYGRMEGAPDMILEVVSETVPSRRIQSACVTSTGRRGCASTGWWMPARRRSNSASGAAPPRASSPAGRETVG